MDTLKSAVANLAGAVERLDAAVRWRHSIRAEAANRANAGSDDASDGIASAASRLDDIIGRLQSVLER